MNTPGPFLNSTVSNVTMSSKPSFGNHVNPHRMADHDLLHTLIIGAGQAGLSACYHLKQAGVPFLILESNQAIGNNWRQRYDSLVLFTPARYSSLPGYPFPAPDGYYPTKEDVARYLSAYASRYELPVALGQAVTHLRQREGVFHVTTTAGQYRARRVVVATGPFTKPLVPSYPGQQQSPILQLHSSEYKSPDQLPEGPVLVVGGGNSGAQIAVELSGRFPVSVSVRKPLRFKSLEVLGRSIFFWGTALGILHARSDSFVARRLRAQGDPVYGRELERLLKAKRVPLLPEIKSFSGHRIAFADGQAFPFQTLIWATGFAEDFSWIGIPELFDQKGRIRHQEGVSPVAGLYFLGLPWQRARSSALLMGAGRDALFIAKHLLNSSGHAEDRFEGQPANHL